MLKRCATRAAGFTLIEMIVTMGIFALMVALIVPSLRVWVADSRVRAVADSLQNGVRLAQAESLRRSRQVVFALTNGSPTVTAPSFTAAANGANWAVATIPAIAGENSAFIGFGILVPSNSKVVVTGSAAICFNSLGRMVANTNTGVGAICSVPTTGVNPSQPQPMINYVVSLSGASHYMQVEVALGGQVHLCDPSQQLSDTNPYGC